MTEDRCTTFAELDRLLNDPETPLHPARVGALADELARQSGTANRANDRASTW